MSLGCAKNLVDAEIMLGSLLRDGVEIVNDPSLADALIVNTCSFIDAAQEESVNTILESAAFRSQRRPDQAVVVSGCLPQRFRDELPRLLPEVDAFMGIDQVEQVGRIVEEAILSRAKKLALPPCAPKRLTRSSSKSLHRGPARALVLPTVDRTASARHGAKPPGGLLPAPPIPDHPDPGPTAADVRVHPRPRYIPQWDTPRFRLTPRHFAYIKIAEGCNHPCSFCIIPRMRGSHRSRALADVVEEAGRLIDQGARELNLISQDSTYYGLDLRPGATRAIASPQRFTEAAGRLGTDTPSLCTLLRALNELNGEFWVRLLYTHPAHWTDELIATLADCPKVARYVDMPLQHIHDDMLARMRRETSGAYIRDLISRIRSGVPGIAIRTTFIVGFPGETKEHFDTLLEFIRATRFERLGVFCYSREEGTIAGRMGRQVPAATRRRRRDLAMAAQREVARQISAAFVGREWKVLVEGQASERDLPQAARTSWEHGRSRPNSNGSAGLSDAGRYSIARGEADAPDIDGRVYVRGRLTPGEFVRVRILGHSDYDLVAEEI